MSSVLDRGALEQSPLADLHLLANELGVDGFRRLRKADLIDAILAGQGGTGAERRGRRADAEAAEDDEAEEPPEARRGEAEDGRARAAPRAARRPRPRPRARRGAAATRRGRAARRREDARRRDAPRSAPRTASSRASSSCSPTARASSASTPPEPTDDDVYVSAAQVKRCELVSGDRVAGPVRPPRRSERFPSLIRVDTINGRPADEVAEGTRFEDLPAAFPAERFELGSEDPTVKAIEWLTPFGKGSRVVIAGRPAGRQDRGAAPARRRAGRPRGARGLGRARRRAPRGGRASGRRSRPPPRSRFGASADAQAQAVEQAVEQGRRVAARGGDAVVLIDSLDAPAAGRRAPRAGRGAQHRRRRLADRDRRGAGAVGGETTVIALDAALTALGRFPALDLGGSAARCGPSCWWASRAPRRSPRPARDAARRSTRMRAAARAAPTAAGRRPGPSWARGRARSARGRARAGRSRRSACASSKTTSSSPSLTRWSSQAERNTSRRSQCTSERSAGPTSSGQQSLTCSPRAEAGSWTSPLTVRFTRSSSSVPSRRPPTKPSLRRRLLDALGEVALVEREAELAVLQDVVLAGVVVSAAHRVHGRVGPAVPAGASASYARVLPGGRP